MKKSKNIGYDLVYAQFMEEVNNPELQNRFSGFKSTLESSKSRFYDLVAIYNKVTASHSILTNILINSAKLGFLNEDAVNGINEKESEIQKLEIDLDSLKIEIAKNEDLIKKYKESSENKLFFYWKTLKTLNPEIKPWLEWKIQFVNKIF